MNGITHLVDKEWADYISVGEKYDSSTDDETDIVDEPVIKECIPKPSEIYISTKTKIVYLNTAVDLKHVFWQIPVIPYAKPTNGVVKKQIKCNTNSIQELNEIQEKLQKESYFDEHIITSINNPIGRIVFKDIRKITIGISKKDLTSYRCKKKSAFYNCFVLIFRIKVIDTFKEFHVKVFNTGKIEMPGVQNEIIFNEVLKLLLETLQPHITESIAYKENSIDTVLINSNFKCGFYINREILYDILRHKYNIQAIFDPCSYPGIQCKFYYNHDTCIQTGSQIKEENKINNHKISEVSFMIFRTGSVLIVGKCDEDILFVIYDFLKNILIKEYAQIHQKNNIEQEVKEDKKKKLRKKIIVLNL